MTLKQQSVQAVKWTAISAGLISLIGLIQMLLLAHLLLPSDFGLMGMIHVVLGMASLFGDLGINSFIIQRQQQSQEHMDSLYCLGVGMALVLSGLLWLAAPAIVQFYGEPKLKNLLLTAIPILILAALGQPFQALLEKMLSFAVLARLEVVCAAIGALAAIGLAYLGYGPFALLGGAYANLGSRSIGLISIGRREWTPQFRFSFHTLQELLPFGLNRLGHRTSSYISANIDFLVVGSFVGAEVLGYYTLAYNLANVPSTKINSVISRVIFPVFSKVQDDNLRLKRGYLRMHELSALVNFPFLLGMVIVAPIAIPTILGSTWSPAVPFLQILSVVGLGASIVGTIGPVLLAKGRTDLGFKWSLLVMMVQVPGIVLGVLWGGAIGVSIAFACLQTLYVLVNYPFLVRALIGPSLREYLKAMWPALWMSTTMAVATFAARTLLQELPSIVLLFLCVILGGMIYLSLVSFLHKSQFADLAQLVFPKRRVA
jgi:O-antigen/teichoic acid export membrane protein